MIAKARSSCVSGESAPATRRTLMTIGGATLLVAGSGLAAPAWAQKAKTPNVATAPAPRFPHVDTTAKPEKLAGANLARIEGGTKPIYIADARSKDPLDHSVADTLFWADIMMEHAAFFVMLMPGDELAEGRAQAKKFQDGFKAHLDELKGGTLDKETYAGFNRRTIDLVKPFIDYKQTMQEAQDSGRLHSLVWSTFFAHTRNEAERFTRRLEQYSKGSTEFERGEVVRFWAQIMDEHALFIAHLLDPQEESLIQAAEKTRETFEKMRRQPQVRSSPAVTAAVEGIIDFKTAALKGINAGSIKSIIHPTLADHVRREAVRFKDELGRSA